MTRICPPARDRTEEVPWLGAGAQEGVKKKLSRVFQQPWQRKKKKKSYLQLAARIG